MFGSQTERVVSNKQSISYVLIIANMDFGVTVVPISFQFCKGGHRKGMVGVHTCRDEFYLAMDDAELVNRLGNLYSMRQNLSLGFPTKQDSNQYPRLQRPARKLKFHP